MFKELRNIIENSKAFKHGKEGDVLASWIISAENEINKKFPKSYKWFLLNYGWGYFYSNDQIYTITPPEFRDEADADIVYQYNLRQLNPGNDPSRVYFYEPEGMECYFFDTARFNNEDCPVVIDFHDGRIKDYGGNFEYFLRQEIDLFDRS